MFERLLYTDCRAGQGRGGGAGFQIQAQSSGVTPALSRMAVETLLYASQPQWLTSGRAVEDFPLGLAHTARDGWGTSQSRYLGQEVTGGRSGNHLADCLLTTDTELYGAIRPAQLLESDAWRAEPFDSVECPPFDGFLQPGPLTNAYIQGWLKEDTHRPEVLKRLVSILGDQNGPSVLILADSTEQAVRWIAAATILLPMRVALDLSFKVFVNNINQSSQRIIAVPKELNPTIRTDSSNTRFVIDASDSSSAPFEATALADFWVDRLVEAEDAYDVVEAVDLADVLAGHDPTLTADAHETAWAVIAEGEKPENPNRLLRWLTTPKDPSLGEYEVAIASRLVESNLADVSTLLWMERQADAGRLAVDRASLRRAVMTAEIAAAPGAFDVRREELSLVDIGDEAKRDAESAISSAILLANDGGAVDRLLRTARRHGVQLNSAPLQDCLHAFIADWIAHPSDSYDPGLWALSESLIQDLTSQLSSSAEFAGGYAHVRPLLAQVWVYLLPRVRDPSSPLAWELNAASVATANERTKMRQLESIVKELAANGDYHYEGLAGFQRALVGWRALSGREAMVFVDTVMPPRARPASELSDLLWATVRGSAHRPDKLVLDTILHLADWQRLPSSRATDELHRADQQIADFLAEAEAAGSAADFERLRELKRVNPTVIRIRMPDLVEASLGSRIPTTGLLIIEHLPSTWQRDFFREWARALSGEQSVEAAVRGYLWSHDGDHGLQGWQRDFVGSQLAEHASRLGDEDRAAWAGAVERRLGGEAGDFEDFIGHQGRGLRQKFKSVRTSPGGPPKGSKRDRPEED